MSVGLFLAGWMESLSVLSLVPQRLLRDGVKCPGEPSLVVMAALTTAKHPEL